MAPIATIALQALLNKDSVSLALNGSPEALNGAACFENSFVGLRWVLAAGSEDAPHSEFHVFRVAFISFQIDPPLIGLALKDAARPLTPGRKTESRSDQICQRMGQVGHGR